ncbi:MAG: hypothetical protein HYW33_00135 [Candidatus Blackburnbacteria bacterium]|nr:hypothetical protein [Candidatus Blackburnbacteria bacterium]
MINNGIVNIRGREYMTVARRLEIAHQEKALESVQTEVLSHNPIVIKATVVVKGKPFTGISAVNPETIKVIERQSPYEVAETSAVGRALGFAGYGLVESVASADEMVRALTGRGENLDDNGTASSELIKTTSCVVCGQAAEERRGVNRAGKQYHAIFCSTGDKTHTQWIQVPAKDESLKSKYHASSWPTVSKK